MKFSALFVIAVIVFSSCGDPVAEKRVYTEKDIEGYWATNNAIKNTLWLDTLASKPISRDFLRFYNQTFGIADTVYRISNDTISIVEYDYLLKEKQFVQAYKIVFAAADRMILKDLSTEMEITYYSLFEIPTAAHHFDSIKCYPGEGGLGSVLTVDSLVYYSIPYERDRNICAEYAPRHNIPVDSLTISRLQAMYARLKPEDILFARSPSSEGIPMSYTLEMNGDRGLEIVGSAACVTNPLLRAIYWEMAALDAYQVRESW